MGFKLTFLGTNGWYPTHMGSTVSALLETPDRYVVLDAGDGLHKLDVHATDTSKPVDVFLSHFHLDHTFGLHIQPKFHFKNEMRVFAPPNGIGHLRALINHPYSAPPEILRTKVTFHEIREGKNTIEPPNGVKGAPYSVTALPLDHADPCYGLRFEFNYSGGGQKVLSYCTDTGPCENLILLSRAADALITECSLLPGEPLTPSWPHMNPESAAKAANEAGCRRLFLTHFAAQKYVSPELRAAAERSAGMFFPNAIAAHDGMETDI